MTNNNLILLILIFLVNKAPYPSIVYFFKESVILVVLKSHTCKANEYKMQNIKILLKKGLQCQK